MIQLVKKKGRPCKGRGPQNKRCTFKFTQEDYNKLDMVSKNRGISHAELVRKAIDDIWRQDLGI